MQFCPGFFLRSFLWPVQVSLLDKRCRSDRRRKETGQGREDAALPGDFLNQTRKVEAMTSTVYLLTDKIVKTADGYQWVENGEDEPSKDRRIKGYEHPLLAELRYPWDFPSGLFNGRLWQCEAEVVQCNGQVECDCTKVNVIREVSPPQLTLEQKVTIAILCAMHVFKWRGWTKWAEAWLSGDDRARTATAAMEARDEVTAAAQKAWDDLVGLAESGREPPGEVEAGAARESAKAATEAAEFMADYARRSTMAETNKLAAHFAVAMAVVEAARADSTLDIIAIAEQVVTKDVAGRVAGEGNRAASEETGCPGF